MDLVIAESQFKSVNIKTTQMLARLMGISIYLSQDNEIPIEYISPTSARKIVTGDGKMKKEEVAQYIIDNYYNIGEYSDKQTKKIQKTSDIYDSILLNLAILKQRKLNEKYKK